MPSILDRYFYQVDTGDDEYTHTPNGPPVVSRLIKGKSDVWLSPEGQALKPKTLLIDKNEFMFDTQLSIIQKLKTLRELLNATPPFECWVWDNKQFVQLSSGNLSLLSFQSDRQHYPRPIRSTPEKIEKAFLLAKEVSIDSIITIETHDLKEIAANKTLPFTAWLDNSSADELAIFYNKSRHRHLIKAMEYTDAHIKPKTIEQLKVYFKIDVTASSHHWQGFDDYVAKERKKPPERISELLSINGHNKLDRASLIQFLQEAGQLQSLKLSTDIDSISGTPPLDLNIIAPLEHLTYMTLTTHLLSPDEIGTLLSKAPNCDTLFLYLQSHNVNADFPKILTKPLTHLRRLGLFRAYGSLNEKNYLALLEQCPSLEDLEVNIETLPRAFDERQVRTLKRLKKLDLSIQQIIDNELAPLFNLSPELHSLTLKIRDYRKTDTSMNLSTLKLDHLTYLNVTSIEDFQAEQHPMTFDNRTSGILNAAPKLETLVLKKITFLPESLTLLRKLPHLKSILLDSCKIDSKTLTQLLNKTPALETLSINSSHQKIEIDEHLMLLPHLHHINLSARSISREHLMHLLENAPNLKSVTLSGITIEGSADTIREGVLAHLEDFNLSRVTMDPTTCHAVLALNTNLKQLTLEKVEITEGDMPLCHLNHLVHFSINKTIIKATHLSALLNEAESLDRLALRNSSISEKLTLHTSLPKLKTLVLQNSDISTENLETLINSSINLKVLDLPETGHSILTQKTRAIKINSMPHLVELLLVNTRLQIRDIIALLEKAPNLRKITINKSYARELLKTDIFERHPDLKEKMRVYAYIYQSRSYKRISLSEAEPKPQPSSTKKKPDKKPLEPRVTPTDFHPRDHSSPQDPPFDPRTHTEPDKKKDKPFQFNPGLDTLNQGRIINLLSQYLRETKTQTKLIQRIQSGICVALSQLFSDMKEPQWQEFKRDIFSWNGESASLERPHHRAFKELLRYVNKYQLNQTRKLTYAGEALIDYLAQHPGSYQLENAWHAIAIKFNDRRKTWTIYDPNYVAGEREVEPESLADELKKATGPTVSILGQHPIKPQTTIQDQNQFLENGGGLILSRPEGKPLIHLIDPQKECSDAALDGLFLMDTEDHPAWFELISNADTKNLGHALLQQVMLRYPNEYQDKIGRSLAALPEQTRRKAEKSFAKIPIPSKLKRPTTQTQQPQAETRQRERQDAAEPAITLEETLESLAAQKARMEAYKKRQKIKSAFETRHPIKKDIASPVDLVSSILNSKQKKQLIEYEGYQALHAATLSLLKAAKEVGKPVFIVHSPDDLTCAGPWIEKDRDGIGKIHDSAGGPLVDFMRQQQESGQEALILINYANFKPKDIVRFNTIVDADRMVDGVFIPDNINVLGLSDLSSPNAYKGGDFYSRFDSRISNPFTDAQWQSTSTHLPPIERVDLSALQMEAENTVVINFYHGKDWQDTLFGNWELDGGELKFKEGELLGALESRKTIVLQNAPWQDKAFELFWAKIQIDGGFKDLPVPPIRQCEGYEWEQLKGSHQACYVACDAFYDASTTLLNPNTINQFISNYRCDNEQLIKEPGLIQQHQLKHKASPPIPPLPCLVTSTLSDNDWAKLLTIAKEITLDLKILPNVTIPDDLSHALDLGVSLENCPIDTPSPITVSTDIDASVQIILKEIHDYTVIDATECSPSDLLERTDAAFDKKHHTFSFQRTKKAVVTLLESGQKVLLTGPFSAELSDALLPYLRQYPEQLRIVSDNTKGYPSLPYNQNDVTIAEKKELLGDRASFFHDDYIEKTPFIHLKTILQHHHEKEGALDTKAPWYGQDFLEVSFDLGDFTPETAALDSEAYIQARTTLINEAFTKSPIICLSGITGVGKSTFIDKQLSQDYKIHMGESTASLKAWQKEGGILFIDEANITARGWSEFEGLFNEPKTIIIEGEQYPLEKDQKVIFAFNPASYSADRETNRLFKRHGNTIVFEPFPLNVIYHEILSPLFKDTSLDTEKAVLVRPILEAYDLLTHTSIDRVLISARELKTIVMMAISHQDKCGVSAEAFPSLIKHYTKMVLSPLVPHAAHASFDRIVEDDTDIPIIRPPNATEDEVGPENPLGNILFTPSRQPTESMLNAFLSLRQYRQTHSARLDETQQFGGLGGLAIEGEPGIGKSVIAQKVLRDWGLTQAPKDSLGPHENAYYLIPASLSNAKKRQLLLQAFDEGAPVIMDEMNTASMLERTLNDLLMGRHPDEHRVAKKPGFIIIATQNPITMKGRIAASQALNRRMSKVRLPNYTNEEMKDILIKKGISEDDALLLIDVFLKEQQLAIRRAETPLNFRDLISVATTFMAENIALQTEKEEILSKLFQPQTQLEPSPQQPESHSEIQPVTLPEPETEHDDSPPATHIPESFQFIDKERLESLLKLKTRQESVFNTLCLFQTDIPFVERAIEIYELFDDIELLKLYLDLKQNVAEQTVSALLIETFYQLLTQPVGETHLTESERRSIAECLKSIKFDLTEIVDHKIMNSRVMIELLQSPLNEVAKYPDERLRLISHCILATHRSPYKDNVARTLLGLKKYIQDRTREQERSNSQHGSFWAQLQKGRDATSKINAAQAIYDNLVDPNTPLDLTPNEHAALNNGRLKKYKPQESHPDLIDEPEYIPTPVRSQTPSHPLYQRPTQRQSAWKRFGGKLLFGLGCLLAVVGGVLTLTGVLAPIGVPTLSGGVALAVTVATGTALGVGLGLTGKILYDNQKYKQRLQQSPEAEAEIKIFPQSKDETQYKVVEETLPGTTQGVLQRPGFKPGTPTPEPPKTPVESDVLPGIKEKKSHQEIKESDDITTPSKK
jgi:hypothetical protein